MNRMSKIILVKRCSECPYQINTKLDAGYLFGCKKKANIVYDTIGGMEFDTHPQCPLRSTEPLLEALEDYKMIPDKHNVIGKIDNITYNKLRNALGGNDNV
jgi:hypothetical protein